MQSSLKIFKLAPLNGAYTAIENPRFQVSTWTEGQFQSEKEAYIKQNFGFNTFFVKAYNQIQYSLYNQTGVQNVVIGQDNYLYDENYITAYYGLDFAGNKILSEKVEKLQKISDTLKSKNISLIVVLAPGKANYYPEFLPKENISPKKGITNYEVLSRKLNHTDINLADMQQWFLELKPKTKHPLFPRTGIHWSYFGECIVLDSLVKLVESIREINLPKISFDPIEKSYTMRERDDDIEKSMNLFFNIEDLKMSYPNLLITDKNATKPSLLTIADSFYWGFFGTGAINQLFGDNQFWYYNDEIYKSNNPEVRKVKEINLIKEIEKNEVIIILSTDSNLRNFGFNFIENLYSAYFN